MHIEEWVRPSYSDRAIEAFSWCSEKDNYQKDTEGVLVIKTDEFITRFEPISYSWFRLLRDSSEEKDGVFDIAVVAAVNRLNPEQDIEGEISNSLDLIEDIDAEIEDITSRMSVPVNDYRCTAKRLATALIASTSVKDIDNQHNIAVGLLALATEDTDLIESFTNNNSAEIKEYKQEIVDLIGEEIVKRIKVADSLGNYPPLPSKTMKEI